MLLKLSLTDNNYASLPGRFVKNIEFDLKGACFSA
jgi:hypothetical protein